jgi:predicted nuclease of restriction endonuclease-like (RecB) superfamily
VVLLIQQSRQRAYQAVNAELIDLYWRVGEYISRKIESAEWGDGVVAELARYIQLHQPNARGFTRSSLFRMRQFYETYRGNKKVAPLLRQLPWTHHLMILGRSRYPEEREFYMGMAIQEHWRSRELDRQIKALFSNVPCSTRQKSQQRCDKSTRWRKQFSKTCMFSISSSFR